MLDARAVAADGDLKAALAAAGEAVRLATERPEGYLVLGDLNLEFGDLPEAERCYAAAVEKAERLGDAVAETRFAAAAGRARALRLAGDYVGAHAAYGALARQAPEAAAGLAPEASETAVLAGDFAAAAALLPPLEDAAADEHFLAHAVLARTGDEAGAILRGRLALFGNLYLLAALLDEPPPDLGLVHGFDEAKPEYALEAAERLRPWLDDDDDALDGFAALAATPTVGAEVARFVELARALMREAHPERRGALRAELERLRAPDRLKASGPVVAEELRRAEEDAGGECGDDVPAPFPV